MDTVQFEATQTARNNKVHDRRNVSIKKIGEISLKQAFFHLPRLPCINLSQ